MNYYKTSFYYAVGIVWICLILFVGIIYFRDPYAVFHPHYFNSNQMAEDQRISDYGLIRFGLFDGVILGTSLLQNTSANEASQKLGGRFANLSIPGGTFYERSRILDFAFKHQQLKNVIISLDYYFGQKKAYQVTFFPELYHPDSALFRPLQVYLNTRGIQCVFLNQDCHLTPQSIDRPTSWINEEQSEKLGFGGFHNWLKKKDDVGFRAVLETVLNRYEKGNEYYGNKDYKAVIDREILPILKHSETEFHLLIPPYCILWWAMQLPDFDALLQPYAYLLEQIQSLPNVHLYWFYDMPQSLQVSNYKDLYHFHWQMNSQQLDAIRDKTHILTLDNYPVLKQRFYQKVRSFNLNPYIIQIQQALQIEP